MSRRTFGILSGISKIDVYEGILIIREYLNPGQEHYPIFDTPWGKAGFLICK
jgi:predicted amidohydrolase